ncbi:MAG: hypothetical protein QXU32_11715 [Nitrososphaerales archaeon]
MRTIDMIVISVIAIVIAVTAITSIMTSPESNQLQNEVKFLAPASEPELVDTFSLPIGKVVVNEHVLIQSEITNNQDVRQKFVYIVKVNDGDGVTIALSWMGSEIPPNEKLNAAQSWRPVLPGEYDIVVFVWDSIDGATILSPARKISVEVFPL